MQRAAEPPAKPGRLRKMHAPSTSRVILISPSLLHLGGPGLAVADVVELPLLGGELLGYRERRRLVVLVDEVRAVAAAPLLEARRPVR